MQRTNKPGKVYGKLTLVKIIRTELYLGYKRDIWLCKCECGNEKEINSQTLRPGKSKSCGCAQKEHAFRLGKANTGRKGNSARNLIVNGYKNMAKDKKREYNLTFEYAELLLTSNCYYCGNIPSKIQQTQSGIFIHGGIDRIDSDKGYVIGNVVPCCWFCNCMKNKFSKEQFLSHIEKIMNYQLKKEQQQAEVH